MADSKTTKRALFSSVVALFLSFTMLLGTTFAWFTDSAVSGRNVIQSGNLDVVLEYKNNWEDEWAPVDENTKIFKEGALYEPGYTEVVFLRVSNGGSLALKYNLNVTVYGETLSTNVYDEEFSLKDHLEIGYYSQAEYNGENDWSALMQFMFIDRPTTIATINGQSGSGFKKLSEDTGIVSSGIPLLPGETSAQLVALVLTMPETVGNEANHKADVEAPTVDLGVTLLATQFTHEEDSFDNQYDANAEFPVLPGKFDITNNDELNSAFSVGGEGTVMDDFGDAYAELGADKEFALNLNGKNLTGTDNNYVLVNKGNLSVTGDGTITSNLYGSIENWGTLYVNDLNLNVSGEKYGFHCKGGEAEINNLVLRAERGGVNVQGGKITINSADVEYTGYYSGKWYTGYLIYAGGETSEVIINGGEYTYTGVNARQRVICAQLGATVTINGGTFGKGGNGVADTWINEIDGGEVIIKGGSFEFDPSAYVAEGYEAVAGTDGWWTVSAVNP